MCNGNNHPPGCNCRFRGGYRGSHGNLSGRLSHSRSVLSSLPPSEFAIGNQPSVIKDAETHPTACWWCGAEVYYHTNGYGDSVLFDSLGYPWQIHSCWADYWEGKKALRQELAISNSSMKVAIQRLKRYEHIWSSSSYQVMRNRASHKQLNNQRMAILAGVIKQISFIPDELSVASRMGITIDKLRKDYGDLYIIDRSTNGIKLKT